MVDVFEEEEDADAADVDALDPDPVALVERASPILANTSSISTSMACTDMRDEEKARTQKKGGSISGLPEGKSGASPRKPLMTPLFIPLYFLLLGDATFFYADKESFDRSLQRLMGATGHRKGFV